MVATLARGDIVVVVRLDRLARGMRLAMSLEHEIEDVRGARIVSLASQVVDALVAAGPDVILLEFGGDLIGPYRVTECLEALAPRLDHLVFVAFDLCGVNGAVEHLRPLGLAPDTISGPIANNPLGVTLIREQFGLHAESSLEPMTETVAHISSGVSPR
jgi:hypothetical protein